MTVEISNDRVLLKGRCGVEEAEALLGALVQAPQRLVVLEAERLHTALWQILIALKPPLQGRPRDTFILQYVMPMATSHSAPPSPQANAGDDASKDNPTRN